MVKPKRGGKTKKAQAAVQGQSDGERAQQAIRDATAFLKGQGLDRFSRSDDTETTQTVRKAFDQLQDHFENGADLPVKKLTQKTLQAVAAMAKAEQIKRAKRVIKNGLEDFNEVEFYRKTETVLKAVLAYTKGGS